MNSENYIAIEWVWIDLDDTLWDFRANSREALAIVYRQEGLSEYFADVDTWLNAYIECNKALWTLYNQGQISKEYLMMERFRHVLSEAGCQAPYDKVLARHLDRVYLECLGQLGTLVPGARELLVYLRDKGYKIGVLSNGFREVQHNKLRSAGIDGLVDLVVLSDDIGINKPDPRLFTHAAGRAGTSPQHSLMIGDNPDTDIAGAIRSGWHSIYFNRDGRQQSLPEGTTIEITSLQQAMELL